MKQFLAKGSGYCMQSQRKTRTHSLLGILHDATPDKESQNDSDFLWRHLRPLDYIYTLKEKVDKTYQKE